jgi:hypothetical protein
MHMTQVLFSLRSRWGGRTWKVILGQEPDDVVAGKKEGEA